MEEVPTRTPNQFGGQPAPHIGPGGPELAMECPDGLNSPGRLIPGERQARDRAPHAGGEHPRSPAGHNGTPERAQAFVSRRRNFAVFPAIPSGHEDHLLPPDPPGSLAIPVGEDIEQDMRNQGRENAS